MKNIRFFNLKFFPFLVVTFSIYLNRRVFVTVKTYSFICVCVYFMIAVCAAKRTVWHMRPNNVQIFRAGWSKSYFTRTRLLKYIEKFYLEKLKIIRWNLWYFSYFCSKHRLQVLVRTASAQFVFQRVKIILPWFRRGGSNEYPQSMVLSTNKKKIMYTPVNPSFTV